MRPPLVPRLPAHAEATIAAFLRAEAGGGPGVLLGLSGGIDSALCARLAVDALGPGKVVGVGLPTDGPARAALAEAAEYAARLGIAWRVVDLQPALTALADALGGRPDRLDLGNATARLRMTALYAIARPEGRRVLGTGNKSEILLGYFTKHGDGGADLMPIGDLYKTEVLELAERLGLPEAIRSKPPSAGFWEGQTDEEELGLPYREIDRILRGIEELRSPSEIAQRTGLPEPTVRSVFARVAAHRHKRRGPIVPKVGLRTVGIDWRD